MAMLAARERPRPAAAVAYYTIITLKVPKGFRMLLDIFQSLGSFSKFLNVSECFHKFSDVFKSFRTVFNDETKIIFVLFKVRVVLSPFLV